MKKITDYINESKVSYSTKPIHLFKNTVFKEEHISKVKELMGKEWEAALMDNHEDEYLFITTENPNFDKYFNCLNNDKIIDGICTKGIGSNFHGWRKYEDKKVSKYPIYTVVQGTSVRGKVEQVIFADKSFFEYAENYMQ